MSELDPSVTQPTEEENEKQAKPRKRPKHSIRATLRIVNFNFWSFFWFEAFYKLLTFSLFIPLLRKITSLILYFNGISNLTDQNFAKMLLHPATWLGFLAMILLAGVVISVEFAGLLHGIHASDEGKKVSFRDMFTAGIAQCGTVFQVKNWMYLLFVIVVMPLASVAESATLTGSLSIPGFIIEGINEKWYLQVIYIVGMLLLAYLSLRWIYAIPVMNIEKKNFKEATAESSQLMHKRYWKALFALVFCYGMLFLLIVMIAIGIFAGSLGVIHWLDPSVDLLNCLQPVVIADAVIVYILFILMCSPLIFSRIYIGYKTQLEKDHQELPAYTRTQARVANNKYFKLALCACIVIGCYFFLPSRYQEVKLMVNNAADQTMVMAHRGDSVDAPENTLPAFQAAIDHGADAAEMDVQMTKDGTIVVMHDSSIDRTTTGHGNIWDVTYDEIKNLDNGSFFDPSFADTRIPTLDQVIQLCKGKLYLNIEIKRTGHDDGIEQKVLDIINKDGFSEQCDITSMDYNTLVTVRRLDPTIKTVYTTAVAIGNVEDLSAADAFSVETTFVNQSFVRSLRQNGKELFVWTVNDESEMQRMIDLGANAIITNDPVACRELVSSESQTGVMGILNRLKTGIIGG